MTYCFDLTTIHEAVRFFLNAKPQRVVVFHGEMGAGKTTFIKEVAKALGVENTTSSPTFSLVNEYETADGLMYHFDVYRLKNELEALDFGIEDYLYSGHWCFIEWAEKIPNLIPENHTVLSIETLEDGKRKLTIT
ncbi:tRNA (adenosine(37)-N6)-threonylcarbamoyltransferase complex ATPase subunit type 1 TsaE [Flavobacterium orientale]|uniref:tRNA threonylcarbamoyladenosine biosynthesis protein TsaE n=1 Tax=Flavobacterium orientale TaxID=1756020 RepID=A0A916Y2S1_9FLAO|nr:tRNA (adenosine(37)-N6)-threonylcarbamoyltransferase complex ATPase subunit type 1 TsaE [Flavobacterium orientale]GGD27922.1 tRNA (adenosine(37)-N6)-threonylcarbamoyltransferase complex ATPase subunit type 1 TsaE [Flavobacterium orientale]